MVSAEDSDSPASPTVMLLDILVDIALSILVLSQGRILIIHSLYLLVQSAPQTRGISLSIQLFIDKMFCCV